MSHIITNDEYYKNISNILRERLGTDYHYYPAEMPDAIRRIPQSVAGVDDVVAGIYLYDHDEEGYPTKLKVVGWSLYNTEAEFPIVFSGEKLYSHLKEVEFANCNFKYLNSKAFKGLPIEKAIISGCDQTKDGSNEGAFSHSSTLKYVEFKEGFTHLGDYTFCNDSNLTTVILPESLKYIGLQSFIGCGMTNITIPNNVTTIGNMAFFGCTSLTTINLPSSLTSLGTSVFVRCTSLEFVELGQDFNANGLDLSASTKYSRETILQWLNALADRTGQAAYKLTIGATNLKKLTEEDIAIATAKNWTLA